MRRSGLANNAVDFPRQTNPDFGLVLRTVRAATAVTADQLGACRPGDIVKVRALALPGPGGTLTAPLSGAACVWHRSVFFPVPALAAGAPYTPEAGSSDARLIQGIGTGVVREKMNASEEISAASFAVGEVGGPQLRVDPHLADVDTDEHWSQWWRGRRRVSQAGQIEWTLAAGTPVFVVGRVTADGGLAGDRDAALLVSTRDEDGVLERCHHEAGQQRTDDFIVRSTRFNLRVRHQLRLLLAGIAVAVVLAAVLITVL